MTFGAESWVRPRGDRGLHPGYFVGPSANIKKDQAKYLRRSYENRP